MWSTQSSKQSIHHYLLHSNQCFSLICPGVIEQHLCVHLSKQTWMQSILYDFLHLNQCLSLNCSRVIWQYLCVHVFKHKWMQFLPNDFLHSNQSFLLCVQVLSFVQIEMEHIQRLSNTMQFMKIAFYIILKVGGSPAKLEKNVGFPQLLPIKQKASLM